MEYNKINESITLDIKEYNSLIEYLKSTNSKLNQLIESFDIKKEDISSSFASINDSKESNIENEIKSLREEGAITQKQYVVLIYILKNVYYSDSHLSKLTGVSYSSISQWKKKDYKFKELYRKILLLKTI